MADAPLLVIGAVVVLLGPPGSIGFGWPLYGTFTIALALVAGLAIRREGRSPGLAFAAVALWLAGGAYVLWLGISISRGLMRVILRGH